MRTIHPGGIRERPQDLLDRFGGRLSVFHALAGETLDVHELGVLAGVAGQPEISREIAVALRELYADYEDLRDALLAFEWSDPKPEIEAVLA
jgi:hypothetical protein